jgi:hypothetical protein
LSDLDADVERRQRRRHRVGGYVFAQGAGETEAMHQTQHKSGAPSLTDVMHEEILCRDEDKCGCDQWFDHRRRQPHDIEHGQAEVSEWARVKAVTTLTSGHRLRPQRIKAKRTAM